MVINSIIAFVLAALSSAIFAPITIKLAFRVGAIDVPKDERKIHAKPMPRIGGLSFIVAFFIAVLFVLLTSDIPNMPNLFGFFIGAGIVAAVGFIDDTKNIKPWMKFLGQSVGAVCVIASGLRITGAYGYDANKKFIEGSSSNIITTTGVIIPPNVYYYIRLTFDNTVDFSSAQLEYGSTSTSYEPHKSNILTVNEDVELRGIGDVKDTLNCLTGEVTKRIEEIVLDGGDDEEWITAAGGSVTHQRFVLKRGNRIKPISNVNENLFLCDKFNTVNSIKGDNSKEMCLMEESDEWYLSIVINNTKLNSLTVDGFKSWLQSNNVKIQYVVESESIKTVVLTTVDQDGQPTKLKTFNDITHVEIKANNLIPSVDVEVATKISQTLSTMGPQQLGISETQNKLGQTIDEQTENTDATMMATTEIYEQTL